MSKYTVGEEGMLYGLRTGAKRVKITARVKNSFHVAYLDPIPGYVGQGSILSQIELGRHYVPMEQYNPEIHV